MSVRDPETGQFLTDATVDLSNLRAGYESLTQAQIAYNYKLDPNAGTGGPGPWRVFGGSEAKLSTLDDNMIAEVVAIQPVRQTIFGRGETSNDSRIHVDAELAIVSKNEQLSTDFGDFDIATNLSEDGILDPSGSSAQVTFGLDSLHRSQMHFSPTFANTTNTNAGGGQFDLTVGEEPILLRGMYPDGPGRDAGPQANGRGPIVDQESVFQWTIDAIGSDNSRDLGNIRVQAAYNLVLDTYEYNADTQVANLFG